MTTRRAPARKPSGSSAGRAGSGAAAGGAAAGAAAATADRDRFVERFGSALTAAGMQRLPSRVFACLLAQDSGRMTAAEIGEALSVSAASVSGAVRSLQQLRMIHREREPGTRRDVYVVADDAWHDVMLNTSAVYAPLTQSLRDGVAMVGGPGTPAGGRLSLSVEFLEFVTEEMAGLAERWERRRAELGR